MMTYVAKDWIWMLAFFPLWAVTAGMSFALVSGPKRIAGIRMRKFLDASALVLSICSATAVLIGLDCNAYINLPFAQPACHMIDLSRPLGFIDPG